MLATQQRVNCLRRIVFIGACLCAATSFAADPPKLKVLFLGDNGHHQPRQRFGQLQPWLAKRGIELVYTDQVADLNPKTLAAYDALAIYANTEKISPEQEQALLDGASDKNKNFALYLIFNDRAIKALRALKTLENMASAIKDALKREDDDDDDDDHEDDEASLAELIDLLQ